MHPVTRSAFIDELIKIGSFSAVAKTGLKMKAPRISGGGAVAKFRPPSLKSTSIAKNVAGLNSKPPAISMPAIKPAAPGAFKGLGS